MDSFINLAQKGISAYAQSQPSSNRDGDGNHGGAGGHQNNSPHHRGGEGRDERDEGYSKTGGHEYNSPHHSGGGGENESYFNEQEVIEKASSHSSGDSSMFSSALAHINSNSDKHREPIDEEEATEAHRKIYKEGSSDGLSAKSMGSAAALQVLGQFTGGGGGGSKAKSKTDLISLAMAEASKLFDSSGGSAQGNKQDAVNSAGLTIMKLFVQSKLGGGGGAGVGGMGGLMSLASKFM